MISSRQEEILLLAAKGLEKPEIAERLHVKTGTIRTQMERARKHLKAHNTAHAVAKYQAHIFSKYGQLLSLEDD